MITIRKSVPDDIEKLACTMRDDDKNEIWICKADPGQELAKSYYDSITCLTAEHNGIIAAMFGISPGNSLISDKATVWLLTGIEVENMKKSFMVYSRQIIGYFLELYPVLENYVDGRYIRCLKWLQWCGAEIDHSVTVYGVPFYHFVLRRK